MRKRKTTPLSLNKETLHTLNQAPRQVAGASRGCTMWCDYTNTCTLQNPTHTEGTHCCK